SDQQIINNIQKNNTTVKKVPNVTTKIHQEQNGQSLQQKEINVNKNPTSPNVKKVINNLPNSQNPLKTSILQSIQPQVSNVNKNAPKNDNVPFCSKRRIYKNHQVYVKLPQATNVKNSSIQIQDTPTMMKTISTNASKESNVHLNCPKPSVLLSPNQNIGLEQGSLYGDGCKNSCICTSKKNLSEYLKNTFEFMTNHWTCEEKEKE
uniref:Uncharacterized protein n=1 Tax=Megaselia scalaris TaxID=36166 RepID=T1GDZ9_MEGSC